MTLQFLGKVFSKICRRGAPERKPKDGVEWRRPRADKLSKIKPFVSRTFFLKTKPLLNKIFFLKTNFYEPTVFSAHWDLCEKKDLVRNRSTNLFSVHVFGSTLECFSDSPEIIYLQLR